ncbi:MAG: signal recognition particle-docking protein FtsY [Simkaniaceae bacterium]|nr:signal recognition particle-docking protein FtsY [Simkaniaceae bacterium]
MKKSLSKIKNGLAKTRALFAGKLGNLFRKPMNDDLLEELEQVLFEADLGSACALHFVEEIRKYHKKGNTDYISEMKRLANEIFEKKTASAPKTGSPHVILIVGVNGSGKTTTIAKLAKLYKDDGKKVLLAAGDTFRAAAIDQLETWATRAGVEIVKAKPGSDPSAVAHDALAAAKARGYDLVIIDTAGRLQNKTDLMNELEKMKRVCANLVPDAPHETLLILDATTGQNGIDQAKTFNTFTPLSGLVLTKLDGSAKGGIALSIYHTLDIPISFIGVGESIDDLLPFEPASYVDALFN